MKYFSLVNKITVLLQLYYWSQISEIVCLRNVIISMPDAVQKGAKVRLVCKYDLEGEVLYTLKWYKEETEFLKYTPREIPSIKFFPMKSYPDLEIIKEETFGDQVTIKKALVSIGGHYACQVTTDMPSFHEASGRGVLRVVVLPEDLPSIKGYKPKIKEGEWANVTCISSKSTPAANLTWSINNKPVSGKHEIRVEVTKRVMTIDDLEESKSSLSFLVTEKHFNENNSLKVRCTASIYSVYQQASEISILPYRPHKFYFHPEEGSRSYFITPSPNIKFPLPNVVVDNTYRENNNNANEPENLKNKNDGKPIRSTSICVVLAIIMTCLLC